MTIVSAMALSILFIISVLVAVCIPIAGILLILAIPVLIITLIQRVCCIKIRRQILVGGWGVLRALSAFRTAANPQPNVPE